MAKPKTMCYVSYGLSSASARLYWGLLPHCYTLYALPCISQSSCLSCLTDWLLELTIRLFMFALINMHFLSVLTVTSYSVSHKILSQEIQGTRQGTPCMGCQPITGYNCTLTYPFTHYGQFRDANQPTVHVFDGGRGEMSGKGKWSTLRKPLKHRENMQTLYTQDRGGNQTPNP